MTNPPIRFSARWCSVAATGAVVAVIIAGCGRDARLSDHDLRDPVVETVSAYGKTLDAGASPQDVVFVLLQAIVDDYAAGDDRAARNRALDTQFAVCAPEWIKARRGGENLTEQVQRERLFEVVYNWAPTLGFYRSSFAGEFPDVVQRMHVEYAPQPVSKTEVASVYVNCDHPDPANAGPNSGIVAVIQLIREAGCWRIWWVGFDNRMRDWRTRFSPSPRKTTIAKQTTGEGPQPPDGSNAGDAAETSPE